MTLKQIVSFCQGHSAHTTPFIIHAGRVMHLLTGVSSVANLGACKPGVPAGFTPLVATTTLLTLTGSRSSELCLAPCKTERLDVSPEVTPSASCVPATQMKAWMNRHCMCAAFSALVSCCQCSSHAHCFLLTCNTHACLAESVLKLFWALSGSVQLICSAALILFIHFICCNEQAALCTHPCIRTL